MKIKSEDQAFRLLSRAIDDSLSRVQLGELDFEDWPVFHLRITGEKWSQSITPTAMAAFIDLQVALYRSVSVAKYGTSDTRHLTKQDKRDYEIMVKVEEGSSLLSVELGDKFKDIASQMAEKMTGNQIVITVLGAALLIAGTVSYKSYLDNRRQDRLSAQKEETMRQQLETMETMSKNDLERWSILKSIMQSNPHLENIERSAYDMRTDILKAAATGDEAEYGGQIIDTVIAEELAKNARRKSSEIRLDGTYRVLRVDTTDPLKFKITVQQVDGKNKFIAEVQDDLGKDNRSRIQSAEWKRQPVYLKINGKMLGDDISQAVILKAEDVPADTD